MEVKLAYFRAPVFSIITPTYRRPELLRRAIKSVISQTFTDYEHIIIDDGEDPETEKIIRSFNNEKIIFYKNERKKGVAGSYNTGIIKSKGDLLLFLDDDDEYLPEMLNKMNQAFLKHEFKPGFIWTGISRVIETINGQSVICSLKWPERFTSLETALAVATAIGNSFGVCIRRECFEKTGMYDEDLLNGEDTDLMFRLAMNYRFATIPEVLVKIYKHGRQLTGDDRIIERIECKEELMKRYDDFLKDHPEALCEQNKGYADLCYKSGLKAKGRRALMVNIRKFPYRFRNYASLISYELTRRNPSGVFQTS